MVTLGWHDKRYVGVAWHDESHVSSHKERDECVTPPDPAPEVDVERGCHSS